MHKTTITNGVSANFHHDTNLLFISKAKTEKSFQAKTFISWYRAGFGSLKSGHPPGQETPQYGEFLMSRCLCDIAIGSKDRIGRQ
jgi:hypothetical protein